MRYFRLLGPGAPSPARSRPTVGPPKSVRNRRRPPQNLAKFSRLESERSGNRPTRLHGLKSGKLAPPLLPPFRFFWTLRIVRKSTARCESASRATLTRGVQPPKISPGPVREIKFTTFSSQTAHQHFLHLHIKKKNTQLQVSHARRDNVLCLLYNKPPTLRAFLLSLSIFSIREA